MFLFLGRIEKFTEMKQIISSPDMPKAVGPYSPAVKVNGTLYISGQIPVNPKTGLMPDSIEAQTRQALDNLGAILKAAGMTYGDVVQTTVLLDNINDFAAMNAVYAEYFVKDLPARVCYEVAAIPKGALVEIAATAVQADDIEPDMAGE